MSKLFLEAIRALPEDWIVEGTQVAHTDVSVVAVHPERKPMVYFDYTKKWEELEIRHAAGSVKPVVPEFRREYFRLEDFENG